MKLSTYEGTDRLQTCIFAQKINCFRAFFKVFEQFLATHTQTVSSRNLRFRYRSSRPEVFCKKGVLRNFAKFTGKHLCQSLFFNKVTGLGHRCFSVNFAKFLRTPFLIEHLRWLPL